MLAIKFINEIKFIRRTKNLSQRDLAELADMSQSTLSDLERCRYPIRLQDAEKLSNALGLTLIEVLNRIKGEDNNGCV